MRFSRPTIISGIICAVYVLVLAAIAAGVEPKADALPVAALTTNTLTTTATQVQTSLPLEKRFELLRAGIQRKFDTPKFAHAHVGVLIQSLKTGRVWFERNAERLFMPASNEKILTTAAALNTLGPEFRFQTVLCADGKISTPTLEGNLVVFGDGDPTLYSRFYKDTTEVFREWAQQLRNQGITRITGDIIGDDNAWDDQQLGDGWAFDGLDSWSSAEFGPLQVNENCVDLKIVPPAMTTGTVQIIPNLPSRYYRIVNNVKVTSEGRSRVHVSREVKTNDIVVSGSVVAGAQEVENSPTITNPTLFYVTVLREVFQQQGIVVEGKGVDCDDLSGWNHKASDFQPLIVHRSASLSLIARGLMKRSQNMYAETLVHAMGRQRSGRGSFSEGRHCVQDLLKSYGIEPGAYAYMDGSGLTRYNLVSPRILATVLTGMRRSKLWEVWREALPIAGVDGTLAKRMRNTPAQGNVRAKTGTINNVRSLSGYVTTADGEELVFSFIINGHLRTDRETEELTDGVLNDLAAFDGRP